MRSSPHNTRGCGSALDPLLQVKEETVEFSPIFKPLEFEGIESVLDSNSVKFDGIRIWVVKCFSDSEELDGIAVEVRLVACGDPRDLEEL